MGSNFSYKERTCLKLLKENDLLQQELLSGKVSIKKNYKTFYHKSKINEKSFNDKVPSLTNFKNLRPSERRVNSMSSNAFLMGRTYIHDSPTKNLNEEEEIVSKLSEEVKYFKNQHKILAEKLKKSEEFLNF